MSWALKFNWLAERPGAKIITGDRRFKGLKNVLFIE
jgi:hypothetical protein